MEHLQHFGLSQDPFQNEPDLRFYFESASHRDALRRVERGLRQQKGLTVLTGEGGTGKTLLARRLLDSLEEELFEANMLVMVPGAADSDAILRRYARQLGVEAPAQDRSELLSEIYEQLAVVREDGRDSVLILDDAHVLSIEDMAEVGGLLNLEYEDRRLLSLMIVGLPALDIALTREQSLGQRIDVHVTVDPLDLRNSAAYLEQRLSQAGGGGAILPQEAVAALFKYGRGRPRLLNTLADNALFEAYISGRHEVSATDVEQAAGDLGIGPDPGQTYSQLPSPRSVDDQMPPPIEAPTMIHTPDFDDGLGPAAPPARQGDLGDLLEGTGVVETPMDAVLEAATAAAGGTVDLDAGVAASLEDDDSLGVLEGDPLGCDPLLSDALEADPLPAFSAENDLEPASAEATRAAFPGEDPSQAGGSDDALDDLFVELIDD